MECFLIYCCASLNVLCFRKFCLEHHQAAVCCIFFIFTEKNLLLAATKLKPVWTCDVSVIIVIETCKKHPKSFPIQDISSLRRPSPIV